MGLLDIIEQKLKAEGEQMRGELERRTSGVKGGMRKIKGNLEEKIADARLREELDDVI